MYSLCVLCSWLLAVVLVHSMHLIDSWCSIGAYSLSLFLAYCLGRLSVALCVFHSFTEHSNWGELCTDWIIHCTTGTDDGVNVCVCALPVQSIWIMKNKNNRNEKMTAINGADGKEHPILLFAWLFTHSKPALWLLLRISFAVLSMWLCVYRISGAWIMAQSSVIGFFTWLIKEASFCPLALQGKEHWFGFACQSFSVSDFLFYSSSSSAFLFSLFVDWCILYSVFCILCWLCVFVGLIEWAPSIAQSLGRQLDFD